ncbi:putative ABC transport system ATP-binding protein/lipoprotein-releasing system ATP-binding protein [Streptomyces sp. 2224.1]|nr:putative ABC transport system ATP-binding protein/lipoprotein-releasing system ATP-binding protein [Streptomyces sp. 2321.6]SDR55161.1 putative ABC transport system ATP-binding protein/lipoprotein-releasing system ATP-binding protein [Streptomyces sp. KS_16]SEC13917.1 putative ABC transport system ATP-binding protein/lipoprotein-releasing system ATP-binding protein [Streptomyces sp. 2133.1]SED17015.1 putative ABC transport system ATP-binding protein/lipoprotein-releasing system ATP-binding pr
MPLEVRELGYEVGGRRLLDGLGLAVSAGESVAVMGPSGSGKSTLLSIILGLVRPDAGSVMVAGRDVVSLRSRRLAEHRRKRMGMVFQFGELLPELSPVENVALVALLDSVDRDRAYGESRKLLDELGVPFTDTATSELSGGERQRVAVARALIGSPTLLLADEPTGALDEASRDHVAETLFAVPAERGCGLLVVTHDPAVANRADRVMHLEQGALAGAR